MTLLLSCVLYTLHDRSPAENKYIPIFITWLAHVFKYADLTSGDALRLTIDADTHEQLKKTPFFSDVMNALQCEKQILFIERPKTHAEGMMAKYYFKEYTQDVFMYCDIDVLIKKPLCEVFEGVSDNTILLHVEGNMADSNYNMAFPKDWIEREGARNVGFSAGKFALRGATLYRELFTAAIEIAKTVPIETFYTCDQPVFNYAVYCIGGKCNLNMDIFKHPVICVNGHGEQPDKIVLLDLMGDPGNGTLHFDKIFGTLLEYFLTH
jgi:hypothetical protein